jgi:hypothetical protein
MSEMTRPAYPPCPTCGEPVESIRGFGAKTWADPCDHPVTAIIGAGGVTGAIRLQTRDDTPPAQPGS